MTHHPTQAQPTEAEVRADAVKRDRLVETARRGLALLETDRRDPVGRGLLGDAVGQWPGEPPVWLSAAALAWLRPSLPELPLRTERLVLRPATPDDLEDLLAYYGREDVATYLPFGVQDRTDLAASIQRRLRWHREDNPEPPALGLLLELDGRVVGDVLLMFKPPHHSQAEIGWAVHPDAAGRGLVTEAARALLDLAFGHYGFHRVYASLDARNLASARLCERLGMTREGLFRQDFWSQGEWTDSLRYAILADEHAPTTGTATRDDAGPAH
ncbi:GNAT family N-acetyltransferase [Nocardioides campestrisoli]|uniref:GNAT family N-acetyltransferase n=1 Tax=Nocardioides campestrisoli TaxID=2736757 RepID=UPI001CD5120B|nr:GNAT family protein [Nocardioides campestrisoli]